MKSRLQDGLKQARSQYMKNDLRRAISILDKLEGLYINFEKLHDTSDEELVEIIYQIYDRRGLCFRKLQNYKSALKDANSMIEIQKSNPKGYLVKGKLQEAMGIRSRAINTYSKGLAESLDGQSLLYRQLKVALESALQKVNSSNTIVKKRSNVTDPIFVLPYSDIFHHILFLLDFKTIIRCTQVSKTWRRMIITDTKLYGEKLDLTLRYQKPRNYITGWDKPELTKILNTASGSRQRAIRNVDLSIISKKREYEIIKMVFKEFGHCITNLTIKLVTNALFDIFLENFDNNIPCCAGIESLTVTAPLPPFLIPFLINNSPKLKSLNAISTEFIETNWYNHKLRKLLTKKNTTIQKFFEKTPSGMLLEEVQIDNSSTPPNGMERELLKYVETNFYKTLKKISLAFQKKNDQTGPLLHIPGIVNKMDCLEHLSIRGAILDQVPSVLIKPLKTLSLSDSKVRSVVLDSQESPPLLSMEELRLFHCSIPMRDGRYFSKMIQDFGCGEKLKCLFLEYLRLPFLYDEDGYHQFIRMKFPNLEQLSFGGNSEVNDVTACAIVAQNPFPKTVILSHTSTTFHGFCKLFRAGVQYVGLQRCDLSIMELQDLERLGLATKLIESKIYTRRTLDPRIA